MALLDLSFQRVQAGLGNSMHIQNIRIDTKSVAYWPQRLASDRDADDLLRLFERLADWARPAPPCR